jgi:hypothetical protein
MYFIPKSVASFSRAEKKSIEYVQDVLGRSEDEGLAVFLAMFVFPPPPMQHLKIIG